MKRIWILTELYFPEKTSTAYFLTEIAQGLANGHQVSVITANSMYESGSIPLLKYEIVNQVEVRRCYGTSFSKNCLLGRLLNVFSKSTSIFLKAITLCNSSDVILVVTNPPLLPFMALLLKLIKGCNFVLLVHDVYPEVLSASGIASANTLVYRLVKVMNLSVYWNASHIITLGRDMNQLVYEKLATKKPHQPITCIPNWAETDTIYPLERQSNSLLQRLELVNKFVVLYAGNMGRTHDLQILLSAAKVLENDQSNIHFLFLGSGAKKRSLEAEVRENDLNNVTVLSYLPHAEKNIALNSCDLGVISFMPGMAGVSVPSRMYNQMAAGKPILAIADEWSELAQVVQEENIGWVVTPGDIQQLVRKLKFAEKNPALCKDMAARASFIAKKKYNMSYAITSYKKLFNELMLPNSIPNLVREKVKS